MHTEKFKVETAECQLKCALSGEVIPKGTKYLKAFHGKAYMNLSRSEGMAKVHKDIAKSHHVLGLLY